MISRNLSTLRKLNKLTLENVADKIGVSRQAVAKWEAGTSKPDLENCVALAALYKVSLDDLVNYSEQVNQIPIPPKGKHIFGIATLGEKGQIVIPKKARDIFQLVAGDQIAVLGDEDRGIALIKADVMTKFYEDLKKEK